MIFSCRVFYLANGFEQLAIFWNGKEPLILNIQLWANEDIGFNWNQFDRNFILKAHNRLL
jgi:hypothetical protein